MVRVRAEKLQTTTIPTERLISNYNRQGEWGVKTGSDLTMLENMLS